MPQRPLAWLLALLLLAPAAAQDAQQPEQVFRAETELVLVPVTVADPSNRHIPHLRRENFEVRLNRKHVGPTVFEEIAPSKAEHLARAPADDGAYSNRPASTGADGLTIVLLDYLNAGRDSPLDDFADRAMGFQAMLEFLSAYASQPSHSPLAAYTLGRRGLNQVITSEDSASVMAGALEFLQAAGSEPPTNHPAHTIFRRLKVAQEQIREDVETYKRHGYVRARITREAMQELGRRYSAVPGRKSLVWITARVGQVLSSGPRRDISVSEEGDGPGTEEVWQDLSTALIATYPVDIRGLVVLDTDFIRPVQVGSSPRQPPQIRLRAESQRLALSIDMMKRAAEATGGRAFYGRNDLAVAVREAMEESRSYYLLGFYVPKNALRPGWQSISVSLRGRSGATLRYRRGFYARPGSSPAEDWEHKLRTALASPVDLPGIPLTARLEPADAAGEGKRPVTVHLNIAAGALTIGPDHLVAFDTVVTARGATGGARSIAERRLELRPEPADLARLQQGGINYSAALELEPDDRVLRVVVHDRSSGRLGTLTIPLVR